MKRTNQKECSEMGEAMNEVNQLKKDLEVQHYLLKAVLYKAGGELEITKEEFLVATGMHFQMTQYKTLTRCILQKSKSE